MSHLFDCSFIIDSNVSIGSHPCWLMPAASRHWQLTWSWLSINVQCVSLYHLHCAVLICRINWVSTSSFHYCIILIELFWLQVFLNGWSFLSLSLHILSCKTQGTSSVYVNKSPNFLLISDWQLSHWSFKCVTENLADESRRAFFLKKKRLST